MAFLAFALGAAFASVETSLADPIPGSRFPSARAGALSEAFLPLADRPGEALFYNPAALATLKGIQLEPMNLVLQGNNDYFSGLNSNFYKVASLSSYAKASPGKRGAFPGAGAALLPSLSVRGLAFGILADAKFNAQNIDGMVRYRTRAQLVPAAGIGLPLARGIMNIGYVLQYVSKTEGENTLPADDPSLSYGYQIPQGWGLSHNAALGFRFPFQMYPSLQIVGRNVGGVRYKQGGIFRYGKASPGPPPDELTSIDVSFSLKPRVSGASFLAMVFEGRDLTNASNTRFYRRAAVGLELQMSDRIFLRGGWGGAPSAGLGLKGRRGEFHFSWASEYAGRITEGDREAKYLLQYQVRAW